MKEKKSALKPAVVFMLLAALVMIVIIYFVNAKAESRNNAIALVEAIQNNDIQKVIILCEIVDFETEVSFYERYDSISSPFKEAIRGNRPEIVEYLIRQGIDVNKPLKKSYGIVFPISYALEVAHLNSEGNVEAAALKVIKLLLKHGADVKNSSVITSAVKDGKIEIVEAMIQHGPRLEREALIRKALGLLPIDRRLKMVKLLASNGARITDYLMRKAIDDKNFSSFKVLIKYKLPEMYILRDAVQKAPLDIVKVIIERRLSAGKKVPFEETDDYGISLLMGVARFNSPYAADVAGFLIKRGVNLDTQDKEGNTALMWAIKRKNVSVARLLIEAGAKDDISNKAGLSPRDMFNKKNSYLIDSIALHRHFSK